MEVNIEYFGIASGRTYCCKVSKIESSYDANSTLRRGYNREWTKKYIYLKVWKGLINRHTRWGLGILTKLAVFSFRMIFQGNFIYGLFTQDGLAKLLGWLTFITYIAASRLSLSKFESCKLV